LGSERALVVHGAEGIDEISTCGPTKVSEISDGKVETYTLDPSDLGFQKTSLNDLVGGGPAMNARIVLEVLEGKRGVHRDIVVLNAAGALYISGLATSVEEGIRKAKDSIDSGNGKNKLTELIRLSNA
jgi:anthranilate phosphoribosyltransferase